MVIDTNFAGSLALDFIQHWLENSCDYFDSR